MQALQLRYRLVAGVLAMVGPAQALQLPAAVAAVQSEADELAKEATRRFKEGEFEVAARLFMKAYALDKRADRVFNAARAYEQAGKPAEAIPLFRLYLEITDSASGRAEAEVRLERLEREARKPAAAPEPVPAPTPAPAPTSVAPAAAEGKPVVRKPATSPARSGLLARGWAPVAVGSAGVGLAAVGLGIWLGGRSDADTLRADLRERNAQGAVTGITQRKAQTAIADADDQLTTGGVIMGLGLGMAAAGAVWALWPTGNAPSVSVVPHGDGWLVRAALTGW